MTPALAVALGTAVAKKYSSPGKEKSKRKGQKEADSDKRLIVKTERRSLAREG